MAMLLFVPSREICYLIFLGVILLLVFEFVAAARSSSLSSLRINEPFLFGESDLIDGIDFFLDSELSNLFKLDM